MRRFTTVCALLALSLCGCDAADAGADAGAQPDAGAESDTTGADTGAALPSCEGLTEPRLAACVVEAGTTQDAPEWIEEGVTHDLAGVVVETGAGAPPDDCLHRGPNYSAVHGAAAEVLAPARWFRLEDAAGTVWTVWLLLGEHTPALATGEAVVVHSFYRMEPFAPSPGHVLVTRPGGALVAWFGTDGTAEALAPPEGVTLVRGAAVCAQSDDCGAWAGYALDVTAGESAAAVGYGETATVGGLQVVHGGQRLEFPGPRGCADWFVADVDVALVPLPVETPEDEPRPRAL